MALLYFESFDLPSPVSYWPSGRWTFGTGAYTGGSGGRRSTSSMYIELGNFATTTVYGKYSHSSELSSMVLGMAVKPTTGGRNQWLGFKSAANGHQFSIAITAAGAVAVKASEGGSVLAQSADGVVTMGVYQYVELKVGSFTGSDTIEIRIDGTAVLGPTGGLNLRQSAAGGVKTVVFTSASASQGDTTYHDDLYLCDTSGGSFNDFLGDVKVTAALPDEDGAYSQFTPNTGVNHWACVDDMTNYVESATVAQKDSYGCTLTGDLATIHAVALDTVAKNPDTGVAGGTPFWRVSGVDYDEDEFTRGDTMIRDRQIALVNPGTGVAWTKTGLNAAEFGIKFSSAS